MAENGKTGVAIVVSVLISVGLTVGMIYFLTPYMFPQKGVVQTKTLSLTSDAFIFASQTTPYLVVNQTQMDVTTRGGSFLDVRFTAQGVISLDPGFTGAADWWVAVVVNSTSGQIGNRTVLPHFLYSGAPVGFNREEPAGLSIEYVTPTLAKGTYNITVQWESRTPSGGLTYLVFDDTALRTPRVLLTQEIVP
ncbi:MAG TPA: hypothetical protein VKM55_16200 [Candidatus Lokiarchaeia archaeon]|nr:hypothetical protein [Candidatus Lokiarchaeia archaeon]